MAARNPGALGTGRGAGMAQHTAQPRWVGGSRLWLQNQDPGSWTQMSFLVSVTWPRSFFVRSFNKPSLNSCCAPTHPGHTGATGRTRATACPQGVFSAAWRVLTGPVTVGASVVRGGISEQVMAKLGFEGSTEVCKTNRRRWQFRQRKQHVQRHGGLRDDGAFEGGVCMQVGRQSWCTRSTSRIIKGGGTSPGSWEAMTTALKCPG